MPNNTNSIELSQYPIFADAQGVWDSTPSLRSDCSGYLRAVAAKAGIILPAFQANGLIIYFQNNPSWLKLGHDAKQAADLAKMGYFVVGGEAESPNGHVVVVVPGWSTHGAPMGYWGRLHSIGRTNASLTEAWIGPQMWNGPYEVKQHPHKPDILSPLASVLYFALPALSLKPVQPQ